jgi:hypothetical protein
VAIKFVKNLIVLVQKRLQLKLLLCKNYSAPELGLMVATKIVRIRNTDFCTLYCICQIVHGRSGDIITCATRMLQFSSEMQQTWHTYYPRPQEQLLLKVNFKRAKELTLSFIRFLTQGEVCVQLHPINTIIQQDTLW